MGFKLGDRSEAAMAANGGIHASLYALCHRAAELSQIEFFIIQGRRSEAQQKINVDKGASQTMRSRHITGHAIDFGVLVNGKYLNGDTPTEYRYYEKVAETFKVAALELKIPIVWGGDWKTLKDGGHIELDRRKYS